jgi:hypothetical protein
MSDSDVLFNYRAFDCPRTRSSSIDAADVEFFQERDLLTLARQNTTSNTWSPALGFSSTECSLCRALSSLIFSAICERCSTSTPRFGRYTTQIKRKPSNDTLPLSGLPKDGRNDHISQKHYETK